LIPYDDGLVLVKAPANIPTMSEFTTVSASSYDPASLATKLTEKSAEGWSVVSIVAAGGDVTAFLSREGTGFVAAAVEPAVVEPASSGISLGDTSGIALGTAAAASTWQPTISEPAVAAVEEPAGWGLAPESVSPVVEPVAATPSYVAEPVAAAPVAVAPEPAPATPAVPAGWYADPSGRYELRYWDGGAWTEHVSRAGQQYTDPPVA
jgi:hypothetical protein